VRVAYTSITHFRVLAPLPTRKRLNRDFGRKSWGDEGFSRKELAAELGSAFLCADLELQQEPREENAAYIATRLAVLKNDNRAIFAAAAHAQRATDYLKQKAAGLILIGDTSALARPRGYARLPR
jgi:antirestriction protein ArdC